MRGRDSKPRVKPKTPAQIKHDTTLRFNALVERIPREVNTYMDRNSRDEVWIVEARCGGKWRPVRRCEGAGAYASAHREVSRLVRLRKEATERARAKAMRDILRASLRRAA